MQLKPHILLSILPVALSLLTLNCADNDFKAASRSKAIRSEDALPIAGGSPIATIDSELPGIVSDRPDALLATFPASQIKDDAMRFSLRPQEISASFKLTDITSPLLEQTTQITRTAVTQMYKQGSGSLNFSEIHDQASKNGVVDILIVIDDSGSMENEQANLSSKMNELLVSLVNTDWRIGVITTGPAADGKCSIKLINSTDADAAAKFKTAIEAGTKGNGNEQGIRQAVAGLGCGTWLRAGAPVAVLIVSDEDNCSDGQGCGNELWNTPNYLINYVEGTMKRTVGKDAGFYGIFTPPGQVCPTGANIGNQYKTLVDYKANGAVNYGNICDTSYKTTLNQISSKIASLLKNQFVLQNQPISGSLAIKLQLANATEVAVAAGDYVLSGKTITFNSGKEPPAGSKLLASYKIVAADLFNAVTLDQVPAPGTVKVQVNGSLLAAGSYIVSGSTVTFVVQPAPLADIIIDYRLNMALIQNIKLAQTPLANTLSIKVNDSATSNYVYDSAKNEVVFPSPPIDGAKIVIEYTYRQGPELNYSVTIGMGASDIALFDGTTAVNFTFTNGTLTIPAAVHQLGKTLRLQYVMADAGPKSFTLGHTPIDNSAAITAASSTCDLGAGLEIQGSTLIANCPSTSKVDFDLTYKYLQSTRSFALDGISAPNKGEWKVLIDSEPTSEYTRNGSTITLNFDPDLASKVTILYTFPE